MNARLVLTLLAIVTNSSHAQVATVEVISSSPVPGSGTGISRDKVPAPVQTATGSDIEQSGSANLADFMNRRLGSVHINETQGNAFQPDVNYRGFTASPLLGTPQGISLYMDGVRLNQPFGDVVSWDLIPRGAISSIVLMPGSNPVFGLNTLGGTLSIQTKDGRSAPGTFLDASLGRFGHRLLAVEHGGSNEKGLDCRLPAGG